MAESYRLFLALWPDGRVRDKITAHLKQASLTSHHGKPVTRENLHITLRYIGSVDEPQLTCIRDVMAKVSVTPFELVLDHQACWSRPQVAWLGCHQIPEALLQLVTDIESALVECGFEPEPRPYVPHLTFKRKIKHFPATDIPPISWPVDAFALVLSEHSADGVRYSVLHRWS